MLHAKEFRLGNKLFNRKGEVITVQQLLSNSLIYDSQINISRKVANTSRFYSESYTTEVVELVKEIDFHDVVPIALTPKILEKCGFRNFVRDEWIISYGNTHTDFEFTSEGLRLRHSTPTRVGIKYVHQLQNFFFAITGHELEVDM
ncbi:MAG: hypothetical protein JST68_13470 [Bacteroidetes bacterium]|nr:hypothetical protein [Bacteroidota bacterium]